MIFKAVSQVSTKISGLIAKLRIAQDNTLYEALTGINEALLLLAKEISITNGTNSEFASDRKWKSRPTPACRATKSTTTVVAHNTVVALAFDTNDYDDVTERNDKQANFHSITTNNTRFYVHEEGKYRLTGNLRFPTSASAGVCYATITKTTFAGVASTVAVASTALNSGLPIDLCVSSEDYLFPGDYIELTAFQFNAGSSSLTLPSGANMKPSFCISGRM